MGCHTWFSVPYKTDKKEIIELAQIWLNKAEHISESYKKMYQLAIDNELEDPIYELAEYETNCNRSFNWILYKDIYDYSLEKYNKENNLDIKKYSDEAQEIEKIESYSNEPRIRGYPDTIIKSYDEMVEFMKTGFDDGEGKHHDFQLNENRREMVMNGIKTFFNNHPQGIITFD